VKQGFKLGLAVSVALITANVSAAESEPVAPAWKGEAELGVVATRGNTRTQTVSAKATVTKETAGWRHNAKAEALNSASRDKVTGDDTTTAERYIVSGKSDYKFSEHDYVFGNVIYENDHFSGYDYRMNETLGYGRRLLHSNELTLDVEAGPGARQSKPLTGDTKSEFVFHVGGNFAWKLSPAATFTEEVSSDIGDDATISKSVTALKAQVAGNLAMKASLTVKHTSTVPVGVNKTDAETALTLVYAY